jgi:hypothetical protein
MARKPYPALDGMRNVQRLLKAQNRRIGEVNLEEIVDNRFIRKIDESGFFERRMGNEIGSQKLNRSDTRTIA